MQICFSTARVYSYMFRLIFPYNDLNLIFDFENYGHGQGQNGWPYLKPDLQSMFVFCFVVIGPFFPEIRNSIFDFDRSRSTSWPKSNKIYSYVVYRSGTSVLPIMKKMTKIITFLWHSDLDLWPMTLKNQLAPGIISTNVCAKFKNKPCGTFL